MLFVPDERNPDKNLHELVLILVSYFQETCLPACLIKNQANACSLLHIYRLTKILTASKYRSKVKMIALGTEKGDLIQTHENSDLWNVFMAGGCPPFQIIILHIRKQGETVQADRNSFFLFSRSTILAQLNLIVFM